MVAIKDVLAFIFLMMFFVLLFGLLAGRPNPATVITDGALVLRLNGTVSEQPAPIDPLSALTGDLPMREYRRADLVHALEAAAQDDQVKTVVLDLAIDAVADKQFGVMVALRGTDIVRVPLLEATGVLKTVPPERYAEVKTFFG